MKKEILTYPKDKEILLLKSEEADVAAEETQVIIQDLKDTLHASTGVGISAIQIGIPKRICIIHINNKDIVLINPVVTKKRGEVDSKEGCLSAPNTYTTVKRAQKVWIDYYDENGRQRELAEGGLCSIIAQHELDHFDGGCVVFDEYDKIDKAADEMVRMIKNKEV